MDLKTLFKSVYGKNWEQASWLEKSEALFFSLLLIHWLAGLFSFHD